MKNIEDNSMERTAELTPAESETLLRGHVLQQPENENQERDWNTWCPGAVVGEVINSAINPVLYSPENSAR